MSCDLRETFVRCQFREFTLLVNIGGSRIHIDSTIYYVTFNRAARTNPVYVSSPISLGFKIHRALRSSWKFIVSLVNLILLRLLFNIRGTNGGTFEPIGFHDV